MQTQLQSQNSTKSGGNELHQQLPVQNSNAAPNLHLGVQPLNSTLSSTYAVVSQIPQIPPLIISPPKIAQHSYSLYYERKHLMLINDQQEFSASSDQINVKFSSHFINAEKHAKQYTLTQQQQLYNITNLVKCERCQKWLPKHELNTHLTFHAAVILENLFLGDKFSSSSKKQLIQRLSATHVVNAASELVNHFQTDGIVYFNMELLDNMWEDVILPSLKAAQFIKTAHQNGGKVFVHCALGKSRSVSVILIYLMKYHGFSLKDSLDLVKAKRSLIRPNPNYMAQLKKFEQSLTKKSQ